MKALLFVFAILNGMICCAQEFPRNENGQYELSATYESDSNPEDLFAKAEEWFELNYNNKKQEEGTFHTTNKGAGILAANPVVYIHVHSLGQNTGGGSLQYNVRVEVKEGNYSILLNDFYHESSRSRFGAGGELENEVPECGIEELPLDIWQEIKNDCLIKSNAIVKNFQEYMTE